MFDQGQVGNDEFIAALLVRDSLVNL